MVSNNKETPSIPSRSVLEMIKSMARDNLKGREQLSTFIKRVRQGSLTLDELIGSISAFEEVIYINEKISSAYGTLLVHLFAQLESNWRGEVFNIDIKSVQLCLMKRLLKDKITGVGNLVVWTAAFKEIRFLTLGAKELAVNWILSRCQAEEDDWPVIFHNLFLLSANNRALIFEGLYECLKKRPNPELMNHLIFLIGQNGSLGKSWIKWTLSRGCFNIIPIVFAGLIKLSQEVDYFHVLGSALFSNIKLMQEIKRDVKGTKSDTLIPCPSDYLGQIAKFVGNDSEAGIKGSLQLIESLRGCSETIKVAESFFLDLYKNHPFARRELLKSCKSNCDLNWSEIYKIDGITLKECISDDVDSQILENVIKTAPELIKNLIDHEDQIHLLNKVNKIKALIEIDSVLLLKALKEVKVPFSHPSSLNISVSNWKDVSIGELCLLQGSFDKNSHLVPKCMELCELLQVSNSIEGCVAGKDNLIGFAIDFVSSEAGENVYNLKERTILISKFVQSCDPDPKMTASRIIFDTTPLLKLFNDWNLFEATLKYLIEGISTYSSEFNGILPKIPSKIEFQMSLSNAICRISETTEIPLTKEIMDVIGGLAGRVVSEPQLSKPLMNLLSIKRYRIEEGVKINVNKFSEISDPAMIRAIVEFGIEQEGVIEGIIEELIKCVIIYYGIIDGNEVATGSLSEKFSCVSKLKHVHLNEKTVIFVVTALLSHVQTKLSSASKLLKHFAKIYETNPDEFIKKWISHAELMGMTKGLICGKQPVGKLHLVLIQFYDLMTSIMRQTLISRPSSIEYLKEITGIISGPMNKQVYALIPLQQEKMQTTLKQDLNLKKAPKPTATCTSTGRTVTSLIFSMEKFEETLLNLIAERREEGWCERMARSTARDFKIRLEQL